MIQSYAKANFNKKQRFFTNKRNLSESLKTDSLVGSEHDAKFYNKQHINIFQLLISTSKLVQKYFDSFSQGIYSLNNMIIRNSFLLTASVRSIKF